MKVWNTFGNTLLVVTGCSGDERGGGVSRREGGGAVVFKNGEDVR